MAYTYLIICKPENKVYYGVRYAKKCSPDELGKTYFSSSKHMKKLFEKYNVSDFSFQIRKEFENTNDARNWENKVLKRMKVVQRDDFVNKTDNISICPIAALEGSKKANSNVSEKTRNKKRKSMLGKKMSDEAKLKMSIAKKGKPPSKNHFTSNRVLVNNKEYPSIKKFYNESGINIPYSSLVGKLNNNDKLAIDGYTIERI